MLSLPVIASTYGLIFVAELPDKTALAALVLASKYRPRQVIAGTWAAFLVQTVVAVAAGGVMSHLPTLPVRIASGIGFLIFAILAFRRKDDEEEAEERRTLARQSTRPAWLMSFIVIFCAEWGDLTQLATAALVARGGDPLAIGLGALLALWSVTVLAAYGGQQLARFLKPKVLNIVSGLLFAAIGLTILAAAFGWGLRTP